MLNSLSYISVSNFKNISHTLTIFFDYLGGAVDGVGPNNREQPNRKHQGEAEIHQGPRQYDNHNNTYFTEQLQT